MLSFALPWLFGMSVAAAVGVAGLHLLSVRTPPALLLPTARFVPGGDARAVARQPRPNDLRLLLLRIATLLCAGAALAGVQWQSSRVSTLRLVVADATVADTVAWRDSVGKALATRDAMVDVVFADGVARDPGVALVAATRRAAELAPKYRALSQVELTVVLTGAPTTLAGLGAWRDAWPGAVRVVARLATAPTDSARPFVRVRASRVRDDAVAAAFLGEATSLGAETSRRTVEIARDNDPSSPGVSPTAARELASVIPVRWPQDGSPSGWRTLATPDTVGALVSGGMVLVGPWERRAVVADSLRARLNAGLTARAVAWWSDGEVAAVEVTTPTGCAREVAVVVPAGSDLMQSATARGLRDALTAPCGGGAPTASVQEMLPFTNGAAIRNDTAASAPAAAFRVKSGPGAGSDPWWLTPLLLVSALALLVGEWWWRREAVTQ